MTNRLTIIPITFRAASEFVNTYHRHHKASAGCKFCLGLSKGGVLVGVAICSRPVSRFLDNGETLEIVRLCTDGTRNACSMLYGACCRVAKAMGYKKVITYILESENGASLRASNFTCEGLAGGLEWTGKRTKARGKKSEAPKEMKWRYSKEL